MTDRPNNAITEDIVRIREDYDLSRSDRDALADAANRIQAQGKKLAQAERTFEDWLEEEHPSHNVHDHENRGAYDRWLNELKTAFVAGRVSTNI